MLPRNAVPVAFQYGGHWKLVNGAPQREYCHDYGAEHQGDYGENVFAFHLPRP